MSSKKTEKLLALLKGQPVIPVLRIDDAEKAVPLARALAKGGLPVIEITMRTPAALEAIRRAAGEVPEAVVGAGTILTAKQFDEAAEAGSQFIVSPGCTRQVFDAAKNSAVPLLPGCDHAERDDGGTRGRARFPELLPGRAGGRRGLPEVARLALRRSSLLPDRRGLGEECSRLSFAAECDLRRRLLVAPDEAVKAGDWAKIEALAREAAGLAKR